MTYGYQYIVKTMDSGALAITFSAFPEIISVVNPGDDIAEEAQLTLIDAVKSRLEFGLALPEAEEVKEGSAGYARIAPYILSRPQNSEEKVIGVFEGEISQGFLENLVHDELPRLPSLIGESNRGELVMSVIEKFQDIMENYGKLGNSLDGVRVKVEIVQSAENVYATVEIKAAPKVFVVYVFGEHATNFNFSVSWDIDKLKADVKLMPKAAA